MARVFFMVRGAGAGSTRKRIAHAVRPVLVILFTGVIGYSLFQIWDMNNNSAKEQRVREQMQRYRPGESAGVPRTGDEAGDMPRIVNQTIVDARGINPDIAGWLTMDGTRIDYPFVQSKDNDYYLRRDINGEYSFAGTLFMDYRCDGGLSDFSSVIYGHNIENGAMFSDVKRYDNAEFFAANRTGTIYLPGATYRLEVLAYMRVRSDDSIIYGTGTRDDYDRQRFLKHIEETALRYRGLPLDASDRFVVLSTCTNTSNDLRYVLVARLVSIA